MSATHKVSNFYQTEQYINRIMNQLSSMQSDISDVGKKVRADLTKEINNKIQELNSITIKREQQLIDNLRQRTDSRMAQMEIKHREAIVQQSNQFSKAIAKQGKLFSQKLDEQSIHLENMVDQTSTVLRMEIEEQRRHLNHQIDAVKNTTLQMIKSLSESVAEEFTAQQNQIDDIKTGMTDVKRNIHEIWQEIDIIIQKENNQVAAAQLHIDACGAIWNCAQTDPAVHKFEPDHYRRLEQKMQELKSDGLTSPQAVDALARTFRYEITEMQENAQKKQLVFDYLYSTTLSNAESLLKIMSENRLSTFFKDVEGEYIKDEAGEKIKVEIDFWSDGEYTTIENEIKTIKKNLSENKDSVELTQEKVEEMLVRLKQCEVIQNNLVTTAAYRGILSEERFYISENIINALMDKGYDLQQDKSGGYAHNYMGNDEKETEADPREGVFAVLKNKEGVEITIIINPDDKYTSNQLIFHRNDINNDNPGELLRTINFIQDAIKSENYTMGKVDPPPGIGDQRIDELADANALKQKGIKKLLGLRTSNRK